MNGEGSRIRLRIAALVALAACFVSAQAFAWGWEAHRRINRAAAEALPPDAHAVFARWTDALAEHGPDPDLWKGDPAERSRHYIDLELGDPSGPPFAGIPRTYKAAVAKFGLDSLHRMGTLPWRIDDYYKKLVRSFRHPSDSTIVIMAALGHYVADATQPLHTTVNYDGQETGNRSVHLRFEWWMLEPHWKKIDIRPDLAANVYDPLGSAWAIILNSHTFIDTLFAADTAVRKSFRPPIETPAGKYEADPPYDTLLWDRLGGIAVQRMTMAASDVAGYWYRAWVQAGRPKLKNLPAPPPPPPAN